MAGGILEVIGDTRFCVLVTSALFAFDDEGTLVSNWAVKLEVKILHDVL